MNKRFILLASVLGWVAALVLVGAVARAGVAQAAPGAQAGSLITVTVKAGDNLAKYTRLYGVSGASLRAANPQLKDPNLIFPGQIITIPVVQSFTPSLTTPFYYVVQSGDQLNSLAKQFEQYPDVIAQANSLKNNVLIVEQTLLIPAGPHLHYTVAGETLRSIGARYGVTVQFLLTGNNLPNPDRIFIGQPIFVPLIYNAAPVPLSGLATVEPPVDQ